MDRDRATRSQQLLDERGPGCDRLLHHRAVVPRGVLHPRRDRPRRDRHQPRRRQHPAVHRHRRRSAEGVLRLRRATRLLHRRRPRRRHRAVRAQRRRDPDRAVDADAGPAGRPEPAADRLRRPPADPGRPRSADGASGAAAGHQRRADERAAARDHRATAGSTTTTSTRTPSASTNWPSASRTTRPSGSPSICDVPAARSARRGPASSARAERLLSTVLQGFYQSHQATAAAVQVNNLHLLRGMLGKPGCGILQMNGQPTAQNTRECGADGDLRRLPQLGERRPHRRTRPALERRPDADPALRAAHARDADLPLRRAGLDPAAVGQRHQPGGVAARAGPRSGRSSPRTGCSSSCRTSS